MKKSFFSSMMAALLLLAACASPTGVSPTQPSSSDQVATIVAATMQALPSDTPEPTLDACQIPTLKASDASSDCFNASGEPIACAGLDLLGVEGGLLLRSLPDLTDLPEFPIGFIVTFVDPPLVTEEFTLYLYLDIDQNAGTGLNMSSSVSVLPGIDRLIGVTLPSGESWTQTVARGGYEAPIIRDEAQVSVRVVGNRVILFVSANLLEERSLTVRDQSPQVHVGGRVVSPFSLYVGTSRSIDALDFLNGEHNIHWPLEMTVSKEAQLNPCTGSS
jgi:hypothetical protein